MKKFFLLLSLLSLMACSLDDDSQENFHLEILPIATVQIPEILNSNDITRIHYSYEVPSNCHEFSNLYYLENGNERTIAVVNTVYNSGPTGLACETLEEIDDERFFDFTAAPGFSNYIFNFWQGKDEEGNDIYVSYDIPVQ